MLGIGTGKEGGCERTESKLVLPVGSRRKNVLIQLGRFPIKVVQVVYHETAFFFHHAVSPTVGQMAIGVRIAKTPIKFVCF